MRVSVRSTSAMRGATNKCEPRCWIRFCSTTPAPEQRSGGAVAALGLTRTGQLTVIAAASVEHTLIGDSPPDIETLISSHAAVQDAWFRLTSSSQIGVVSLRRSRADALDSIVDTICSDIPVLIGLSSPFTGIAACSKARAQAQIAMAATADN